MPQSVIRPQAPLRIKRRPPLGDRRETWRPRESGSADPLDGAFLLESHALKLVIISGDVLLAGALHALDVAAIAATEDGAAVFPAI